MANETFKQSHVIAGIGGLLIGGFAIIEASGYPMGSMTPMGPAYFPIMLGSALVLLSLAVLFIEGRASEGPDIPGPSWRGIFWVPLAVGSFAFLVERFGLAPAIFAAIFLSAQSDDDLSLKETLILAVAASVFCVVLFIYILGLPLAPFKV